MKKISLFSWLFILSASIAFAQRTVDLVATMSNPVSGSSVISGQGFQVDIAVQNVGNNPLLASDTVIVGFYIDDPNNLLRDVNNNLIVTSFTGQTLGLNETQTASINLTINHSETGSHQFCALAIPVNRSADSIRDVDLDNNLTCNSLQFGPGSTSVKRTYATLSNHIVSKAYPNPAFEHINFDLKMRERDLVNIVIADLTGRTVLRENKGILSSGDHTVKIKTGHLPKGIYIYDITIGSNRTKGKFSINN